MLGAWLAATGAAAVWSVSLMRPNNVIRSSLGMNGALTASAVVLWVIVIFGIALVADPAGAPPVSKPSRFAARTSQQLARLQCGPTWPLMTKVGPRSRHLRCWRAGRGSGDVYPGYLR